MGSEKEEFKLAERCSVKSSKRIFAEEYVDRGIPFWRSKDVIDKALGEFQRFDLFISEKRYLEISSKYGSPVQGDLLISSVGNRSGQPYVIKDEGDFYFKDGNIIWLSDFSNLDSEFLSYWLKSHIGQSALSAVMIGSAQKALTIDAIRNLDLSFPFLNYQKKAVKILGSLDNKITLNRQLNQTLEQMAQALFKSWFVDFDPVIDNALAAGNVIPDDLQDRAERRQLQLAKADHKPLPENIRKLFPSEFELTESLGWVPLGWGASSFGELLESTIGGDWGKDEEDEKHSIQSVIIRGTDIPPLMMGALSSAPTRWVEPKKLATRLLQDSDIVIEVSGGSPTQSTGRSLLITENLLKRLGGIAEPASFCRKFRPLTKELGLIASLHLNKIYAEGKMWEYQNQSTGISNFQTQVFLSSEFLAIPKDESICNEFFKLVRPLIDKFTKNDQIGLERLRDTLLPKLISGELRIPEAQAQLEEVLG